LPPEWVTEKAEIRQARARALPRLGPVDCEGLLLRGSLPGDPRLGFRCRRQARA